VLTALGEFKPKHFIEDLLKGTDGSSDKVCVEVCGKDSPCVYVQGTHIGRFI